MPQPTPRLTSGCGDAQLAEEQVAHLLVVVLAGVDQHRLESPDAASYASISGAIFMKFGRAPTMLMIFMCSELFRVVFHVLCGEFVEVKMLGDISVARLVHTCAASSRSAAKPFDRGHQFVARFPARCRCPRRPPGAVAAA